MAKFWWFFYILFVIYIIKPFFYIYWSEQTGNLSAWFERLDKVPVSERVVSIQMLQPWVVLHPQNTVKVKPVNDAWQHREDRPSMPTSSCLFLSLPFSACLHPTTDSAILIWHLDSHLVQSSSGSLQTQVQWQFQFRVRRVGVRGPRVTGIWRLPHYPRAAGDGAFLLRHLSTGPRPGAHHKETLISELSLAVPGRIPWRSDTCARKPCSGTKKKIIWNKDDCEHFNNKIQMRQRFRRMLFIRTRFVPVNSISF